MLIQSTPHSRKRTALLTDAFSNLHFTSQLNTVFTHLVSAYGSNSHKHTVLVTDTFSIPEGVHLRES